jgi:PAS domain S-box-containing protein
MLSSLRIRVLLVLAVLISVMAVYVVVRSHEQRQIELERLRSDIHAHATQASQRQEEIVANARVVLEAIAEAPEIRAHGSAECDAELTKLLRVRPRYLQLSILGPSGVIGCSAVLPERLFHVADLAAWPAFRRAMETDRFAIGEYQIEPTSRKQFLDLALPIHNREGEINGVILTAVDLQWLGDSIGARLLSADSVVEIIRPDGTLAARYPHLPAFVGHSIAATELYAALQSHGFSGSMEAVGLDGIRRSYEVFMLRAGDSATAGYTAIGIPEAAAVQAIDEHLRYELIDLGALALIMLLGGYIVSDVFFARPIKSLISMSRRIEAGDRGVRSGLESTLGEVGTLARSMDRMMTAIESYEGVITRERQQLAESQHFAKLFSWRWTLETGAIDVSDSIYSIVGFDPGSWVQSYSSLLKIAHPDDRHRVNDAVTRAIEAKSAYFIEYRAVRGDGDTREFWEHGRCELDKSGDVVAVSAIVQDITLLRGAEREHQRVIDALQRSEDQFRATVEVSPVAMALVALNGAWLLVNESFCRMVGYSGQELLATSLQAMTHPRDTPGVADPVLQTSRYDSGSYQVERRLVCNGGHAIWVLLSASLVRDGKGMPRYFILQMNDISERRAIQLALKASEERYRRLLQVIPDAVTVHRNTQLEFVNDAAVRLLGAGRSHQVLGRSLLEFIHADSQHLMQDHIRRSREVDRDVPLIELRLARPDGSWIDVEATGCSLGEGQERLVVTILRDITVRRRGEQALRDSEEQLRLLADSLPILLARVDRDGRYRFLNLEGERRCAVERSQVLGRSLAEVLGATEFQKIQPYFERSLSGESVTFSTRIRYPNGTERDVEIFYTPDVAPNGAVRGVFMVSIDVTDRMTAQADLKESERRFRQLVESTNAVPYSWSFAAQRYTYLGPQAERLFGHPAERLVDPLFWIQQIHAEDRHRILSHLERLEANLHDTQIEYRVIRDDGQARWLADTVTVETTGNGEKVAHGIIIDVTENKLRDRQIEQAQKIEALGQMTGGIAHDFNNLLTVIVINLELVERQLRGEAEKHRVSQAIRAANAGTELASRMLAFARRQVLRPAHIDLNTLVTDFHSMLGRTLDATIETSIDLADDIWLVFVDRAALEAALLNLTVNARDAMPAGGILTITTANVVFDATAAAARPGLKPGEYSMLAVGDTGVGMAPEVLARAFEPFFTTKEVGKGTGLGLSMVYGFVKQSNSFAYIDSRVGCGTTVRLYFPRSEAREISPISDLSKPAGMPSGNETILVVEDSAAVRLAAASLLSSLGYQVLQAGDGPSALKIIDERVDIDLMVSDIVMPGGMKGPEVARYALQRYPQIKLLYMSGYADDPTIREGVFDPDAELIGKPFHSEELAAKVRQVLDTRKAPRRRTARRKSKKTSLH